jgi:hypothetical protein
LSKNSIFAQKLTKLWTCQISQNKKKHPVYIEFTLFKLFKSDYKITLSLTFQNIFKRLNLFLLGGTNLRIYFLHQIFWFLNIRYALVGLGMAITDPPIHLQRSDFYLLWIGVENRDVLNMLNRLIRD